jgi:hypothetical protein
MRVRTRFALVAACLLGATAAPAAEGQHGRDDAAASWRSAGTPAVPCPAA